jgi:hypothetical protein
MRCSRPNKLLTSFAYAKLAPVCSAAELGRYAALPVYADSLVVGRGSGEIELRNGRAIRNVR